MLFFSIDGSVNGGGEQIGNLQSKLTGPMHLGVCISTILSSLGQWALQIATPKFQFAQSAKIQLPF